MRNLALLFFCAPLVISCSESDAVEEITSPIHQYVVFNPGSYWVYDSYFFTNSGLKQSLGNDSVFVEKDTIINTEKFWITRGTIFGNNFKSIARDSGNYLVNSQGKILLSLDPQHVQEEAFFIGDTHYGTFKYTIANSEMITTSVGIFGAIRYQGKFFAAISYDKDLENNLYYATGVGLVKQQSAFFPSANKIFRELVKYKIAK
jgi:hypothetical protein